MLPVEEVLETGNCLVITVSIWFRMNHPLCSYIINLHHNSLYGYPTPLYSMYSYVLCSDILYRINR